MSNLWDPRAKLSHWSEQGEISTKLKMFSSLDEKKLDLSTLSCILRSNSNVNLFYVISHF